MKENLWYLKRCELFTQLSPAQTRRLERRAVARRFPKQAIIYFPSEPGQSVLVVASGRVKIKDISSEGKETILAFIEEGELFGELALFDTTARSEYAEAAEDSGILAIPREEIVQLMEERADFSLAITKLVALRRKRIENRLRNVLFRSSRERLIALLSELAESHGVAVGGHYEIRLRLSHQELASLIGVTRETVTILLGVLQREGLIRVVRRRITVNREMLAGRSNPSVERPGNAKALAADHRP